MYLIRPTKPADAQIGMLCAASSEWWCILQRLQNITQKTKDRATRTPPPVMLFLLQTR